MTRTTRNGSDGGNNNSTTTMNADITTTRTTTRLPLLYGMLICSVTFASISPFRSRSLSAVENEYSDFTQPTLLSGKTIDVHQGILSPPPHPQDDDDHTKTSIKKTTIRGGQKNPKTSATGTTTPVKGKDATPTTTTEDDDNNNLLLKLNDPTIQLSSNVTRYWMDYYRDSNGSNNNNKDSTTHAEKPKMKLVLTDLGWNHPNQTKGLTEFPRSIRSRELLQAFVDHPYFDPTFQYSETTTLLNHNNNNNNNNNKIIDTDVQYIVMMDIETCFEDGYPNFKLNFQPNADIKGGRTSNDSKQANPCRSLQQHPNNPCDPILHSILDSPLFHQTQQQQHSSSNTNNTLLYFDCSGSSVPSNFRTKKRFDSKQLSILAISAGPHNQLLLSNNNNHNHKSSTTTNNKSKNTHHGSSVSGGVGIDMGFPPPAVKRIQLSSEQEDAISTCQSDINIDNNNKGGHSSTATSTPAQQQQHQSESHYRPYLFSFIGTRRPNSPRKELLELNGNNGKDTNNVKDDDVVLLTTSAFRTMRRLNTTKFSYESLLYKSQFAATPRGMHRFSYRFTEVLSAGAIPVVHADGWVLPYRQELIDWTKCAVIIPEESMNQTIDILRSITPATRCEMRRYCYKEIYQKYLINPIAEINGILDSLKAATTTATATTTAREPGQQQLQQQQQAAQ